MRVKLVGGITSGRGGEGEIFLGSIVGMNLKSLKLVENYFLNAIDVSLGPPLPPQILYFQNTLMVFFWNVANEEVVSNAVRIYFL